MTPGGCIQAVIDLLTAIAITPWPADSVLRAFFRKHRHIGSKDRHVVADMTWAILRRQARLAWWVTHATARRHLQRRTIAMSDHARNSNNGNIRWIVLAYLVLVEGRTIDALVGLSHDNHGPSGLSQEERDLLATMAGHTLEHSAMPRWVRFELPPWLEEQLHARFGTALEHELAALNTEAPLDLRVNMLKTVREEAQALLAAEGIESHPTLFSPVGLRVLSRVDIAICPPFRNGLVEVQDEGSQLIALLTDARPGQAVADYCAGAGGKTLALAACMANKGRLIACDISPRRLERAAKRLRRAGVYNVTSHLLEAHTDSWYKRAYNRFDRVLADVPCTGTGTWRRNPDSRWRFQPEDVAKLTARQADILLQASRLVRPGGRLIYATCSLLTVENETQVERFLVESPAFYLVPAVPVWAGSVGRPWFFDSSSPFLYLTPARQGTDGYFVAVLEKGREHRM